MAKRRNDADDYADKNLPVWLRHREREQEAWHGLVEATVWGKVDVNGVPMEATQTNLCLGLGISHPTLLKYQRAPEFGPAVIAMMRLQELLAGLDRARMELEMSGKLGEELDECTDVKRLVEIDRLVSRRRRGRPRRDGSR